MTRLTIKIREQIVDNAVAFTLAEPRAQLADKLTDLADRLHHHIYGPDALIIETFSRQVDLAHQWFANSVAINIRCDGYTDYLTDNNRQLYLSSRLKFSRPLATPLSVPYVDMRDGCKPDLAPFREAALALHANFLQLVDFEKSLRRDVQAILAPHRTIAKLVEAWPQAAKLLPKIEEPVALPVADPSLIERATNIIFGSATQEG